MTIQRVVVAMCFAFLVMFGIYEATPPVEAFLAEHGWSTVAGPAEVVIVEDYGHRTPAIGAVVVSPLVRDAASKKAIKFRVVDQADTGPDMPEVQWAIDASKAKQLPVICSRHGVGRATVKPLPATPDDAVKYLQAI